MANEVELQEWVRDCLRDRGGEASIVDVCRWIWNRHEGELRNSGDLFFTWQYDVRWAADALRRKGVLRQANESPRGIWRLREGR